VQVYDPDVTSASGAAPPTSPTLFTIGELARRTGVTQAVLRTWEARHGFPVPERSSSGHRRYRERDVALVNRVLERQRAGVRLEVAIEDVLSAAEPALLSVFAMLRSQHPQLAPQPLHKSTLLALTHAIEDEYLAGGDSGVIFGAFQQERFYRASRPRWSELARQSRTCMVFADFTEVTEGVASQEPAQVPLATHAPMRREWAIVAEASGLSVCLAGWEPLGQHHTLDRHRRFDVVWTVDPYVTRAAARVCVEVARTAGSSEAFILAEQLGSQTSLPSADPTRVTALFSRAIGYVDRQAGITSAGRGPSSSVSTATLSQ
jgi:DICT domain-containing protein